MKYKFIILFFILLIVIAVFFIRNRANNDIIIGCIAYSQDEDFLNGLKLYYSENAEENQKNIKLNIKEVNDSMTADNAFNELKKEEADIIISALDSKDNIFSQNDNDIPIISTKDYSTDKKSGFKLTISPEQEAQYLTDFIIDELKLRTVAVLFNSDYDYSNLLTDSFKTKLAERGGEISVISAYNNSATDYSYYINSIAAYKPQVLLVFDNDKKAADIIEQAYNIMPIQPTFVGSNQWEGIENNISNPIAFEGSYYLNCFSVDDSEPEIQMFINSYIDKYDKQPNANAAMGYDALSITYKSIDEVKEINNESIANYLKFITYKGVGGEFQFSGNTQAQRSAYVSVIIEGEKVLYSKLLSF